MTRHLLLSMALSLVAIGASLLAGPHRRGALVGAVSSSTTALASLLFMQRGARARKPLQVALAIMTVMFLTRILVVALATVAVVRAGDSVVAFIVAFFVPYFIFAAIEGAYLHALNRGTGTPA